MTDENELNLKYNILGKLKINNLNFSFELENGIFDLCEPKNHIYIKIITNEFHPQRVLYGIFQKNLKDVKYIGFASETEIILFHRPDWNIIKEFSEKISKELSLAHKEIPDLYKEEALTLLNKIFYIGTYNNNIDLSKSKSFIYLDENTYVIFQKIFSRYKISASEFIDKFWKVLEEEGEIRILKDRTGIIELTHGNKVKAGKKIINLYDALILEQTRIKKPDKDALICKIDTLEPLEIRRSKGKFFTEIDVGKKIANIIREVVNPTFILEPYVGTGSLILPFIGEIDLLLNDINKNSVSLLRDKIKVNNCHLISRDFISEPILEILNNWGISKDTNTFLIYSNPPFGTSTTGKIASQKTEKKEMDQKNQVSRKIKIDYYPLSDRYGKGDLVLPATAQMIEVIKHRGNGYLAFFCPLGIFCDRKKYKKLSYELFRNFEFHYGEIFSGESFNDVNKDKAIAFTIWKFKDNINTTHENLWFFVENKKIYFKQMQLLKDGWDYDNRKEIRGEISIQGNDRFNISVSKNFKIGVKSGGSEIVSENVKIPLNLPPDVPSELAYGLWSSFLGYHAFISHPLHVSDSYTHLPDFKKEETREILAYAVLLNLITELIVDHTDNIIGFVGKDRKFKFGGKNLTKGAKFLIEKYKSSPVGTSTLGEVFQKIKKITNFKDSDTDYRRFIKIEINKRLEDIGYWDYIPIPITKKINFKDITIFF